MEELLQKLIEAEILSESTKQELEDVFKSQLDEAVASAKDNAAADVRAELTEQWITERDTLIEAIDAKVGEYLEGEVTELKEDIERFRDLEAEYAEKLVEAKAELSVEVKSDLAQLVEKLDTFLEMRLTSELEELHEDIQEVRKNEFGRKIFEAFVSEYIDGYADDDSAAATLKETSNRLKETEESLREAEEKCAALERSAKMESVLSPLSGRQKEVMEAILRNVETENLEEGYKTFIGRVLRETTETVAAKSEQEDTVLAEGKETSKTKTESELSEGVLLNGDNEDLVAIEESTTVVASEEFKSHLQRLAGIN